ncbi:MAG: hypothetical protein KKF33_06765 [Alphaproteobacteria bacterium]|nr:hypothetical protein [Alphaproteobacteria bacterium]
MILIWSGWGFLVALVWLPIVASMYNTTKTMGDAPLQAIGVVLVGSLVASAVIWGLDRLIRRMTYRTLVDQQTGVAFGVDRTGSFFFVPMRFWVYLVPAVNLAIMWAYWK